LLLLLLPLGVLGLMRVFFRFFAGGRSGFCFRSREFYMLDSSA
jgi:hypothetical protein